MSDKEITQDLDAVSVESRFSIDIEHLQRMLFVYNAILNGWTVRKVSDSSFEFKKKKELELEDIEKYLRSVTNYLTNSDSNSEVAVISNEISSDLNARPELPKPGDEECLKHFISFSTKTDTLLKKR